MSARLQILDNSEHVAGQKIAMFFCPACDTHHGPHVTGPSPVWGWNGSVDRPTFTPSIRVTGKRTITDDEYKRIMAGERLDIPDRVCHSFVTDGRIQYLPDCTHALAGQTIDLPEIDL